MVKKNKIIPVLFLDIVVPSKKPEVQKRKKKPNKLKKQRQTIITMETAKVWLVLTVKPSTHAPTS